MHASAISIRVRGLLRLHAENWAATVCAWNINARAAKLFRITEKFAKFSIAHVSSCTAPWARIREPELSALQMTDIRNPLGTLNASRQSLSSRKSLLPTKV